MTLDSYFAEIDRVLRHPLVRKSQCLKDKRLDTDGLIEGKVIFPDESELHFMEYLQLPDQDQVERVTYRYHYQDKRKGLIFRYDNAPHFPELATYPDHKHTTPGVSKSFKPTLEDVLDEIAFSYLKL